jgi:hypothetical protein
MDFKPVAVLEPRNFTEIEGKRKGDSCKAKVERFEVEGKMPNVKAQMINEKGERLRLRSKRRLRLGA